MQDRLRQDVVLDLRDLTQEERTRFLDLQMRILEARHREAEADEEASKHWAGRAAIRREAEELKLAEQKDSQAREQKYRDMLETREREWARPSRMHYVEMTYDEQRKQFAATYCGVTAYGDSPEMACDNFDHLWLYGS
jgi:hypothetical protein